MKRHSSRALKWLAILPLVVSHAASAQRFAGNPASIRWRQVGIPQARIIFPSGLDEQAFRVADIIRHLDSATSQTIGITPQRIDIVLQNLPVVSNGYVGLGPWRSEFYMNPLQNSLHLGSIPWVDMLAMHELRHVQQYRNFRKGLSRFAWLVAGQEGQALANAAAVPDWFFEGDAVFQETLSAAQGRGRLPDFFNEFRSLWQEDIRYRYMKLRGGSMKDLVPNHYQLGYLLVAAGREQFGDDIWRRITGDAVRFKPLVYPFQGAFRRHTGVRFQTYVDSLLTDYRSAARAIQAADPTEWVTAAHKRYVSDHHQPHLSGRDSMVYLKQTSRDIPAWYLRTPSGERRISIRGLGISDYFSHANGRIAYASLRPDAKWAWREFGEIRLLDLTTGMERRLTSRTRYFSPGLSSDGSRVVAVHVGTDGRSELHVLDAETGSLIRSLPNTGDLFHTHPVFGGGDSVIYSAVRNRDGEMALAAVSIADGRTGFPVPFAPRAIAFPRVRGNLVVFTATHEQRDQLWCWDAAASQLRLLTGHYTGSYGADISPDGKDLVYSRFTSRGLRVARQTLPTGSALPLAQWRSQTSPAVPSEKPFAGKGADIRTLTKGSYAVTKYGRLTSPINIHSWRPFYEQPDWTFSLYGQNILNTFQSELYYNYNQNEGYHRVGLSGTYGGLFPHITMGGSFTKDRFVSVGTAATGGVRTFRWDEWNGNLGLRMPFNLSGGRHYRYLTLSGSMNHQTVLYRRTPSGKPDDSRVNWLQGAFSWVMQSQQAVQHIYPRFAHSLQVRQRYAVGSREARQLLVQAGLFLPGILKTHNLVLGGSYQARDTAGQYFFSNNFALARGYNGLDYPRMWRQSVNYHFPIAYPDRGFGQIVYFLRVRGNIFYDASHVRSLRLSRTTALRSFGAEIHFDTKWWNQQPVGFGIRYARLLDAKALGRNLNPNFWEFVMPVDLIPR